MCLEIHELVPSKLSSAPGLAWQVAFKMTKRKYDLLTDINMFLMAEKTIRGGLCHSIY